MQKTGFAFLDLSTPIPVVESPLPPFKFNKDMRRAANAYRGGGMTREMMVNFFGLGGGGRVRDRA